MNIKISKRLQSLPAYAFKEISDKVEALKAAGVKAIDFGVGDPSEPTPDFVIGSLAGAGRKHANSGYPSYIGLKELRQAAADYMKRRFSVALDPETEISSNIGSKEAIFNFPEGFINPGDIVICPSPGYPPMKTGTIFAEGVPYYVPLLEENGFLVDFENIPEDVLEKTKIIWINYPNSPTGAIANAEYYGDLIAWARKHNIIIAADEGCYIDIYFDEPPISILQAAKELGLGYEGIVAFYSLSKRNNMTGYRAGFVAGDKAIVDIFKKLKTNIDSGTPNIIQEAAIVALKDDEHVEKMRGLYGQKRDLLLQAFEAIGLEVRKAPATFYIWQKAPNGDDIEFAKRLLSPEIGIVVTPGSLISDVCEGGLNPGKGYVRFALMPTIAEIHEAAEKLKKFGDFTLE
ncbi:aminotransferase class I/II-fold pyridoxal phosphate-dependent enzyme [Candidatus Peregrinibacteria bacterium]|nr:aminotransferase class I/II-fold pyridoxal phosphate-dependent enzyme [Candidatus Peregrinibacteria bacterium]